MEYEVLIILLILFFRTTDQSKLEYKISLNYMSVKREIQFFLYTRENPTNPQQLRINDKQTLNESFYDSNISTKIITHGWMGEYRDPSCAIVRDALLIQGNYNVIVVDWSSISKSNYITASFHVRYVGAHIAKMIDFLESNGSDMDNMTLVGFSLGAHVMGSAGYYASKKVGHIVGLDPAGPTFGCRSTGGELRSGNARFVEVIHTNAGKFGLFQAIGDVDFYPNGGILQPGCLLSFDIVCSHNRAFLYYAESITNPDKWYGIRCPTYITFLSGGCEGNEVVPFPKERPIEKSKGVYVLRSDSNAPFGLGIDGTK